MSGFAGRLSERQKGFKKATDADEARRKREDASVQLRKAAKEEAMLKKRQVGDSAAAGAGASGWQTSGGEEQAMSAEDAYGAEVAAQMPGLVAALNSNDPEAVFNSTHQFRKLLSVEKNPPIDLVIGTGLVPRFVALLREISRHDLQFEAAWVLTNIASGTAAQTRCVVEHGALPLFVELLQSPNQEVREQAVWALGNIAGDSANFRDLVLQTGGLSAVMTLIANSSKTSVLRNATWALSNLCRGKPPPPLEWVTPSLQTFATLLAYNDEEVMADAAWAMSYLSDGANDRIAAVLASGIAPRLVDLLGHSSDSVVTPALRAAGNIVTGDDTQTTAMLQIGILKPMPALLVHKKKNIKKEACWTVSNIAAGTSPQIQEVINANLFPQILHLLSTADFDVKKEATWAISNATAGGSPEQIEYLIGAGCLQPLCDLLAVNDARITTVALDALSNILRTGAQKMLENGLAVNPIVGLIEQADGLTKIEQLQEESSEEVYTKAVRILETYFPIEDDGNAEQGQDQQQQMAFAAQIPQGGFNFGA